MLYAVFYQDSCTFGVELYGIFKTRKAAKEAVAKLKPLTFNIGAEDCDDNYAQFNVVPIELDAIKWVSNYDGPSSSGLKVFNSEEERIADAEPQLAKWVDRLEDIKDDKYKLREQEWLEKNIGRLTKRIAAAKGGAVDEPRKRMKSIS
jgi:hypothetical protein